MIKGAKMTNQRPKKITKEMWGILYLGTSLKDSIICISEDWNHVNETKQKLYLNSNLTKIIPVEVTYYV